MDISLIDDSVSMQLDTVLQTLKNIHVTSESSDAVSMLVAEMALLEGIFPERALPCPSSEEIADLMNAEIDREMEQIDQKYLQLLGRVSRGDLPWKSLLTELLAEDERLVDELVHIVSTCAFPDKGVDLLIKAESRKVHTYS